jgi:hypothetical protein
MRKLIVSLIVVLVVGAGGYFGLDYWAQHAVAREIDAMLDGWRASIGSATRGRIEVDVLKRAVKVTDVVVQPQSAGHPKITMAQLVGSGIDLSGKPSTIEIVDLDVTDVLPTKPGVEVRQKAPRVTLTDFLARPVAPRKVATALDAAQFWLEQFIAVTAAKIEIPSLTVTVTQSNDGRTSAPISTEYTYTNLVLRDVRDGKVAEATTDGIALRGNAGPPFFLLTGQIGKSSILDADMAPLLAFLDPSRFTKVPGYQRVYRHLSMGPYTLQMGVDDRTGMSLRIDGLVAEDIGLDPGKLSLDDLTFLTEITGSAGVASPGMMPPVQPGQLTMLMDKMAGLYEGVSVGKLQMQRLSVGSMRDQFTLASIGVERMEKGRLAGLSLDGIDLKPPFGDPIRVDRIALKGFDLSNFMRLLGTELVGPPGLPPSFDRLAGGLPPNLLEGFEVKGFVVPDPKTGRKMLLDARITSGQVIGSVPTEARGSFKITIPISLPAPPPIDMLAIAGFSTLVAEADVGVRWIEATETLTVDPMTLEVGGVMALSVKTSLGKVSRDLLSPDPMKVMQAAIMADIGPIEVTLRDLGLVDLLAAEAARLKGQAPEAGRTLLLEGLTSDALQQLQRNPGAKGFYDAVSQFLQGKGETLTVRLTPRGRVGTLALLEAFRLAPDNALLAAFTVEASSTR